MDKEEASTYIVKSFSTVNKQAGIKTASKIACAIVEMTGLDLALYTSDAKLEKITVKTLEKPAIPIMIAASPHWLPNKILVAKFLYKKRPKPIGRIK